MKRKKREAILKERVTATLLIQGRGKSKFVLCDITPLTEHLRYEGPQEIAKNLQEASYMLTKYSLADIEAVGAGNGMYHLLIPEVLSTLKFLSDSLDNIKEVQTA